MTYGACCGGDQPGGGARRQLVPPSNKSGQRPAADRAIGGGPSVWALAKRGMMTLGKPGFMREAAIACAT
jgi:hypothetical protein